MHILNLVKLCQFDLKMLSGNEILAEIKGPYSSISVQNIMCNTPKLDLVIFNAYIKFGEILPSSSRDIERKRNSGVNKGPLLLYKCGKHDV